MFVAANILGLANASAKITSPKIIFFIFLIIKNVEGTLIQNRQFPPHLLFREKSYQIDYLLIKCVLNYSKK